MKRLLLVLVLLPLATAQSPQISETHLPDGVVRYDKVGVGFWQGLTEKWGWIFKSHPFAKSLAFLVGVGDYAPPNPKLRYVANDLTELREFLLREQGFDTVYVAQDDVATADLVDRYMFAVLPTVLGSDDRLLFYFSGHGTDLSGVGYLEFGKAGPNYERSQYLKVTQTEDWSRVLSSKHVLFLIDACNSGLGYDAKVGEGSTVDQELLNQFSGDGSRNVLTAGTGAEKSFQVAEGNKQGYSVFTRAFLDSIRETESAGGFLTLTEILAGVERRVAAFSHGNPGRQMTPRRWQIPRQPGKDKGTFIFLNPKAQKPSVPSTLRTYVEVVPKLADSQEVEHVATSPPLSRVTNPIDGLTYVKIPQGKAFIGCDPGRDIRLRRCLNSDMPRHEERIPAEFYMGETEVTVGAYSKFASSTSRSMPDYPYFNKSWQDVEMPVVNVTWNEAEAFCGWAGKGKGRLPSEVEWEYAARAGHVDELYPWGNTLTSEQAVFGGKSGQPNAPRKAGTGPINDFGLKNMVGNVSEWTSDKYRQNYLSYTSIPDYRTYRGGSFADPEFWLRIPSRRAFHASEGDPTIGFRCVLPDL